MKNIEKRVKTITVCGSLRFKDEMIRVALEMELAGNNIITPIFSLNEDKDAFTEKEIAMLGRMHREKIKLSDAILVVNVNGYIGDSTRSEIEYAKAHNKEILFFEQA